MDLKYMWKARKVKTLTEEEAKVASERLVKANAERKGKDETEGNTKLPTAISNSVIKQFLVGSLIFLLCLGAVIAFRLFGFAFGFLFSAYLFYNGASLLSDYKRGKIIELVLLCSNVSRQLLSTHIVMQDVLKDPVQMYTYYMPKKNCPFFENCVYLVYENVDKPHSIVAWMNA